MVRRSKDPNAAKALEELKLEIANDLGLSANLNKNNPAENIFIAGPVGGLMTRRLVEMGERKLTDDAEE